MRVTRNFFLPEYFDLIGFSKKSCQVLGHLQCGSSYIPTDLATDSYLVHYFVHSLKIH